MNKTVLVVCGVLIVACTGAWTPTAAAAARNPACPSPSTSGAAAADSTASTCSPSMQPKAETPAGNGPRYTVSKSVSPSGHVDPGQQVTYTVTVKAKKNVTGAGFTDDLSQVLDDATYNQDANPSAGTVDDESQPGIVSWVGEPLTAGDTVTVTYSVTVHDPDHGDGVLHNDAEPSPNTHGECGTCAVTSAVSGTFTVAETSSPRPGASVRAGQTINYTVTVAGGDAPGYAQLTDSLSSGLSYSGDADASSGDVGVSGGELHWSGHLDAGAHAKITFAARVDAGARQVRSTVTPVSADPYDGHCAPSASCALTHRLVASAPSSGQITTPPTTPPASTGGSQSAVALPDPPSSSGGSGSTGPAIADTGAHTFGLGTLGLSLLIAGTGLLAVGGRTRRRARHGR